MITVIIISILATMALPSYQEHVLKGRRGDAKNALHSITILQEKFYSQHGFYGSMNDLIGGSSELSAEQYYTLTMTCSPSCLQTARPQQYVITATPISVDLNCGSYSLNQTGINSSNGSKPNQYCW
jgi:type IV pilus assembly protein PilE